MDARQQSRGEELANSLSHGLVLLAGLVVLPYLLWVSPLDRGPAFAGVLVFVCTMLLLYLTSTLYHALPQGRAKQIALRLDYAAIFLFIAGSYTPFALGIPGGAPDWWLLALVWSLAIAGTLLKALGYLSRAGWSTGLYLALGWLVLMAALPLLSHLSGPGVAWLVSGGLAYSVGVVFFALDTRVRFAHSVWHGFVAAGTGCHLLVVLGIAA